MSKPKAKIGGPTGPRTAFFEITEGSPGEWHWGLWSGNGRLMARNPEPYDRRKDVVQAVKNLVKLVPSVTLILGSSGEPVESDE